MVYFDPTTYSWNDILGPVLGKDKKLGLGNSVWSSPLLLGEGLINMLERVNWIEGEARIEGAARDWAQGRHLRGGKEKEKRKKERKKRKKRKKEKKERKKEGNYE